LPRVLSAWHPNDYGHYVAMGEVVRQGGNPYFIGTFYPLPTILWVFVPLSVLPDWFRVVWVIAPFVFLAMLFRRQMVLLLGFVPAWFVVGDAMLDGWLLLPLAWLLQNRRGWAGLGAAIVLFKPQLAILAVMYAVVNWLVKRDWRNLGTFAAAMTVFYAPAFIVNPLWVAQMLASASGRADLTTATYPTANASVWVWKELGIVGGLIVGIMLAAMVVLGWRAWRRAENRAAIFQLLGLMLDPVLYASNFVMALPALRGQTQLLIVTLLSLLAYGIECVFGTFGGGYVLIPFAALYFLTQGSLVLPEKRDG